MSKDTKYACHIDLDEGQAPDNCVLDGGDPDHCFYARRYGQDARKHCGEWKPITMHKQDKRDQLIADLLQELRKARAWMEVGNFSGDEYKVDCASIDAAIKKATE